MIKPFFESERVVVYCGDSLQVLSELEAEGKKFDLLLTDPPYGVNQAKRGGSGFNARRGKATYADNLFEDSQDYLREKVRPIIDKALSMSTLGIVTGGVGSWRYLPPPQAEGCMYQPASPGFNTWAIPDFQPIWYYGRPKGNTGKYRRLSHMVSERAFSKHHPCSKPLEFWKKLMLCGTDGIADKTVLDPFGGSGTTGRAALDLQMRATLIELNPRYCELIAKNCAQMTLF